MIKMVGATEVRLPYENNEVKPAPGTTTPIETHMGISESTGENQ
jgi:hypothetical protein